MSGNLFDPTEDFQNVVDRTETVTLKRPGSSSTTVVTDALRMPLRKNEWQSQLGAVGRHDWLWHLPQLETGFEPCLGDWIVDSTGARWTVLAVRSSSDTGRWRCATRDLVKAYLLDESVEIQKSRLEKGDYGATLAVWETDQTGVAARIEPISRMASNEEDRPREKQKVQIELEGWITLKSPYRIKTTEGKIYNPCRTVRDVRLGETIKIEAWEIE
jgi:hypothetical protein